LLLVSVLVLLALYRQRRLWQPSPPAPSYTHDMSALTNLDAFGGNSKVMPVEEAPDSTQTIMLGNAPRKTMQSPRSSSSRVARHSAAYEFEKWSPSPPSQSRTDDHSARRHRVGTQDASPSANGDLSQDDAGASLRKIDIGIMVSNPMHPRAQRKRYITPPRSPAEQRTSTTRTSKGNRSRYPRSNSTGRRQFEPGFVWGQSTGAAPASRESSSSGMTDASDNEQAPAPYHWLDPKADCPAAHRLHARASARSRTLAESDSDVQALSSDKPRAAGGTATPWVRRLRKPASSQPRPARSRSRSKSKPRSRSRPAPPRSHTPNLPQWRVSSPPVFEIVLPTTPTPLAQQHVGTHAHLSRRHASNGDDAERPAYV
jgi:hypothetical protein